MIKPIPGSGIRQWFEPDYYQWGKHRHWAKVHAPVEWLIRFYQRLDAIKPEQVKQPKYILSMEWDIPPEQSK